MVTVMRFSETLGKKFGYGIICDVQLDDAELQSMLSSTSAQAVIMLQNKYGIPQGNYFLNESCRTKNTKITRGKDGLFIHHVYEFSDEYPMVNDLSKPNMAIAYPYYFQHGENLCYCNYLEHFILHIKIWLMRYEQTALHIEDGLIHYLIPILNDIYNDCYTNHQSWHEKAISLIKEKKSDYIKLLTAYAHYYDTDIKTLEALSNSMNVTTVQDALDDQQEADYPKTSYIDKNGNVCHVFCCGEQWCDIYDACCASDHPLCAD